MLRIALGASLILLAGCGTNGVGTSGCEWVRPVYISKSDVLTEETARQILVGNEIWQRICSKEK